MNKIQKRAERLNRAIGRLPSLERQYEIEKALERTREEALDDAACMVEAQRGPGNVIAEIFARLARQIRGSVAA